MEAKRAVRLAPEGLPTWNIVSAVADAEGVDVTDVDQPLGEVVDTDALDELLTQSTTDIGVMFRYGGYFVEVHGDGTVTVSDAGEGT